jgi:hypothetical protein
MERGKHLIAESPPACGAKVMKLVLSLSTIVIRYSDKAESAEVNGERWRVTERDYDGGWYRGAVAEVQKDDVINVSVAFGPSKQGQSRGALVVGIKSADKKSLACANIYDLRGTYAAK